MPKLEARKPRRDHMPVTAGLLPDWNLGEIEDNYLIAELIRRGVWRGPASKQTHACCGTPAPGPHAAGCPAVKRAEAQAARIAAEDAKKAEAERLRLKQLKRTAAEKNQERQTGLSKKERRAEAEHAAAALPQLATPPKSKRVEI